MKWDGYLRWLTALVESVKHGWLDGNKVRIIKPSRQTVPDCHQTFYPVYGGENVSPITKPGI